MAKEVVTGTLQCSGNNWDAMHRFGTGKDTSWAGLHGWSQFGTRGGGGKIGKALQDFYKKYNLNPCITAVKMTVDPDNFTVSWEFTIEESPDGNAYVGMSSWGGASGGYLKNYPKRIKNPDKPTTPSGHAYTNYLKELQSVKDNHKNTKIANVIDFFYAGGFRQIFFQFTYPDKYPNKPKSPGLKEGTVGVQIGPKGSPKNLPEYNGTTFYTTSIGNPGGINPNTNETNNTQTVQSTNGTSQTKDSPVATQTPVAQPKISYLIQSKISLKKISGPGEIIGITEVDAKDGKADFSGIQFSDPGDYVIEVIPSNKEDLVGTTFSITVSPEPVNEEQSSSQTQDDKKVEGNRPIIAQIEDPKVKLEPIQFPASDNEQDNASILGSVGTVPWIHYAGAQIKPSDIESLEIYYEDCVPKIVLSVYDTLGRFRQAESNPILQPEIEVFINSNSTALKPIHMKFILISNTMKKNGSILLYGSLDIKDFYKSSYKSYKMTTFEALKEFASDMKLGFNSNIETTNDLQVWSRKGGTGSDFLKEIFQHAYINDDTFVIAYIDWYYCLNYVDIQKEYDRDNSKDVGIISGGPAIADGKSEEDRIVPMTLSNEMKNNVSPFTFMTEPRFINNTEAQKRALGTQTETKSYDRLGKRFMVWVVDAITGDQNQVVETRSPDDIATNTKPIYRGKTDTDNVHATYNEAYDRQHRNFTSLLNNQVEVILPVPNLNLYKYQKVNLVFVNQKQTLTNVSKIDVRTTGSWILIDMRFIFRKGSLVQKLLFARKELNKTPEEKQTQVVEQDNSENKQINENPEVPSENKPIPNEIYKVGQKILVTQNNKEYVIEVTNVLANGTEIEGKIWQYPFFGANEPLRSMKVNNNTNQATTNTDQTNNNTNQAVDTSTSNENKKSDGAYSVLVLNPTTDNEKNISGKIDLTLTIGGLFERAVGTLYVPDNTSAFITIGPIEGTKTDGLLDGKSLLDEMIIILEKKIKETNGLVVKLKYEKNQ